MVRRGTLVLCVAPLLAAAAGALADGPFFASRSRLTGHSGFGRAGVVRSVGEGSQRIDSLLLVAVDAQERIVVAGLADREPEADPSEDVAVWEPLR